MQTPDLECADCGKYGEGLILRKQGEIGIVMPREWSFDVLSDSGSIRPICDDCLVNYNRAKAPMGKKPFPAIGT